MTATKKNKTMPYPVTERLRVMKALQINGFNYAVTSRQTGVSVKTLKSWREAYPEAFNNRNTDKTLAEIEQSATITSRKVIDSAGGVLSNALKRAEDLVADETDLNKVSNLIRVLTPLAEALLQDNKGFETVSSLKMTLTRLSKMQSQDIADAEVIQ